MSESDVYRRQILTYKDGPRAVRLNPDIHTYKSRSCSTIYNVSVLYVFRPYKDTCRLWSNKVKSQEGRFEVGDTVCWNENGYTLSKCTGLCDRRDNACLPTRTKTLTIYIACEDGKYLIVILIMYVLIQIPITFLGYNKKQFFKLILLQCT